MDWTGTCALKEATDIGMADERILLNVLEYRESWLEERPVYSSDVRLHSNDRGWIDWHGGGPHNAEEGTKASGGWGDGVYETFLIPDHKRRMRVHYRIWTK